MTADSPRDAPPGGLDPRAVRRHFARAAATYDAAAVLQREVGARMAERLEAVKLSPATILDVGCGTGDAHAEFAVRYPAARYVALDVALPMVAAARAKVGRSGSALARIFATFRGSRGSAQPAFVCGDVAALPFVTGRFELVWSNLALQWVSDLPQALAEIHRALAVGGLVTFSTFGPDTLKELRTAFAGIDRHEHVGRFADMHDVGDMLVHSGFADPVMHMEMLTLTYPDAPAMIRELKAIGATNAMKGRPHAMMGRRRWERALGALDAMRRDGRIPATFEVIYGHAWKVARERTDEGHAIVRFASRRRA
jgi:malonyl-CoA O-methyltransferase